MPDVPQCSARLPGSLPTACRGHNLSREGKRDGMCKASLPREYQGLKMVVVARLTANEKSPEISKRLIYAGHSQVL